MMSKVSNPASLASLTRPPSFRAGGLVSIVRFRHRVDSLTVCIVGTDCNCGVVRHRPCRLGKFIAASLSCLLLSLDFTFLWSAADGHDVRGARVGGNRVVYGHGQQRLSLRPAACELLHRCEHLHPPERLYLA